MASGVSLKMIGDWKKEVGIPLRDVLAVSMDITGRTGEDACRHAIILMAQSARSITRQAPKRRKVIRDQHGRYWQRPWKITKRYEWMYTSDYRESRSERLKASGVYGQARRAGNARRFFEGMTFQDSLNIGNRGLAKRSWMWGLTKLGARKTGKQISGTSRVMTISTDKVNGYVKENRLDYITKALPPGWEGEVQRRAGNKIMAQARNKLERQWRKEMGLPRRQRNEPRADNTALAKYFLKAA